MRISQLSGESGVPVATIKFYLREHLLHDGLLTSATQARYDESHLTRLRLIKALMGPGGLTVAATRRVLQAMRAHLHRPTTCSAPLTKRSPRLSTPRSTSPGPTR